MGDLAIRQGLLVRLLDALEGLCAEKGEGCEVLTREALCGTILSMRRRGVVA